MFGLCDCNNFFASCERVFRPDLNGKPVVVLSNNDGCIIARSEEAKAIGITMGMPAFQAQGLMQKYGVTVFSGNYQLYGDMSQRVMSILRSRVPAIEVYSVDEAFLDMDNMRFGAGILPGTNEEIDAAEEFGRRLSAEIKRSTGIPVSIGLAPTKTLAKIGSKLCKKNPSMRGCHAIREEERLEVLSRFPLDDVWGIGRRYGARLHQMGLNTAGDFLRLPEMMVESLMGTPGVHTWRELNGIPCIEFEHTTANKQSICISRSFRKEMTTLAELNTAVITFASAVAEKLRKQGSCASQIGVFIYTNRFREDNPQDFANTVFIFETPTDSTLEIARAAQISLARIFRQGYAYKKAGIVAEKLIRKDNVQQSLFDPVDHVRHTKLMKAIDAINQANGKNTVRLAAQESVADFSTRLHVSPCYTTCWKDIMKVNADKS